MTVDHLAADRGGNMVEKKQDHAHAQFGTQDVAVPDELVGCPGAGNLLADRDQQQGLAVQLPSPQAVSIEKEMRQSAWLGVHEPKLHTESLLHIGARFEGQSVQGAVGYMT
ncbi:hypothetical protein [Sphingomonas sp.]|uniref:hypothetical protein n=1 Tax=Sphingomonas sp. TaxID=28214 RepID=UPI0025D39231|nr:hypothetical protein [Sphingomonas sp.]